MYVKDIPPNGPLHPCNDYKDIKSVFCSVLAGHSRAPVAADSPFPPYFFCFRWKKNVHRYIRAPLCLLICSLSFILIGNEDDVLCVFVALSNFDLGRLKSSFTLFKPLKGNIILLGLFYDNQIYLLTISVKAIG